MSNFKWESNYAALDNTTPLGKGATEAELARLASRAQQCVESNRVTIDQPLPDLGIGSPTPTAAPFMRAVRTRVRPGMADQYMALIKNELSPALKKAGVTLFRVRRVQYGGPRTEFYTAIGMSKLAELDGDSMLVKGMGAAGAAKYLEKISALSTLSEYLVYRHQPDLGYAPQ